VKVIRRHEKRRHAMENKPDIMTEKFPEDWKVKCEKCGKIFKHSKVGITRKSEYPGGYPWEYEYCPYCNAGEEYLEDL